MLDELLEQLEYDDVVWEGEVSFPVLGNDVLLVIDASEHENPSNSQIEKLAWLAENIQQIYPSIEANIFTYYKSVFDVYRKALGEYSDELMPLLSNSSEVWGLVTEPGIYIAPDYEGNEIHLEYECTFDVEHGLRVIIKNGKVARVCTQ
jgi:hypothetical protein